MPELNDLFKEFNIVPNDRHLFELAFTHSSSNKETGIKGKDYERLEFMGDAIISIIVAELVFRLHPRWDQGEMSKTRAKLVQTEGLYKLAKAHELGAYIRIGPSISREQVLSSKKILEDVFEAFMGALYIDQGFEMAKKVISKFFYEEIKTLKTDNLTDYKTRLQEEFQAEHRESVTYTVIEEKGPAHDKHFTVEVSFGGVIYGTGSGPTKKIAEQNAAKEAFSKKAIIDGIDNVSKK